MWPESRKGRTRSRKRYFDEDDLRAMNSAHRYGCIAAVDAWLDAGFERPAIDDDRVDWDCGAIIGTGVGGLDTVGERVVPLTNAGRVRRLGSTVVEQVMGSGVSARIAGLFALGNQVTSNSSACSSGTEAVIMGLERIRSGKARRMLVGGVEGASQYSWAGFDAMRVLSRRFNDDPAVSFTADERFGGRVRARGRRRHGDARGSRERRRSRCPHPCGGQRRVGQLRRSPYGWLDDGAEPDLGAGAACRVPWRTRGSTVTGST